ncbi:MAG: hypothetical protein WDO69_04475 [Pseudomonadota bacterium]
MTRGVTGVGWAGWLALLCLVGPARAAKPGQAFRLEYWAEGRCPDADEFARQIQTRAPRLRLAEADEPALGFYAELVEHAGTATGRLTARSPDGREVVREVRGPTCDDVATALALIAALAADPNQPVEEAPPGAVAPPRPVRHRTEHEAAPELAPEPDPTPRWTFGIGGGLGFDSAVAPNPSYCLGIAFDAEGYPGTAWRPLLSVSLMRSVSSSTRTQGGTASFDWLAFRMAACPARWPEETPLFFRPCGFMDAGLLGGEVELDANSQAQTKSWLAVGGFLRTEALVGEVVSFQLDGGVSVPLIHSSFSAGDDQPIAFQVPASGILGRIGLSYRFQ